MRLVYATVTNESCQRLHAFVDASFLHQNARTVCIIGTQPVMPVVYGVKAPL